MNERGDPHIVDVEAAEVVPMGGGRVARLLTREGVGADLLFGMAWLPPGESMTFDLRDWKAHNGVEPQEAYLLLEGQLEISWDEGECRVEEGQLAYFHHGRSYTVTAPGPDETVWAYTVVPPPR